MYVFDSVRECEFVDRPSSIPFCVGMFRYAAVCRLYIERSKVLECSRTLRKAEYGERFEFLVHVCVGALLFLARATVPRSRAFEQKKISKKKN